MPPKRRLPATRATPPTREGRSDEKHKRHDQDPLRCGKQTDEKGQKEECEECDQHDYIVPLSRRFYA